MAGNFFEKMAPVSDGSGSGGSGAGQYLTEQNLKRVADMAARIQEEIAGADGLQKLIQLRLDRDALIGKWKDRADRENPEYVADAERLKGMIAEIVRLERETEESVPEDDGKKSVDDVPFPTITPSA